MLISIIKASIDIENDENRYRFTFYQRKIEKNRVPLVNYDDDDNDKNDRDRETDRQKRQMYFLFIYN